eukprot:COSAG05_NODE_1460_length_4825_cov_20.784173_2_plen_418_part_00
MQRFPAGALPMLPFHNANQFRPQFRRRRFALLNHGNIRRFIRSHSKLASYSVPLLLLLVCSSAWLFSSRPLAEESDLLQTRKQGHLSTEQEDYGIQDSAAQPRAGDGAPVAGGDRATVPGMSGEMPPLGPAPPPPADSTTLADDHPWLAPDAAAAKPNAIVASLPPSPPVDQTTTTITGAMHSDAVALAKAEKQWVVETEDVVRGDVHAVENKFKGTVKSIDFEASTVAKEVSDAVRPVESEVLSVGTAVETEMLEVVKQGTKGLEGVGETVEVIGAEAEEEVIIAVGTMEEMVFSWTFFGVFLFSLWRISRTDRDERRRGRRGVSARVEKNQEGGYPRDRLFDPAKSRRRRDHSDSIFSAVDPVLSEEDQEALELGRLLMEESEAAEKFRVAARNAAHRTFEAYQPPLVATGASPR